jgi:hypothetical protein
MKSLVASLLSELEERVSKELSLSADQFPEDTLLEDDEEVSWVSSTFDGLNMINIYEIGEPGASPRYIASGHSDGGVVVFAAGPWDSLDAAEASFGDIEEDWTRL